MERLSKSPGRRLTQRALVLLPAAAAIILLGATGPEDWLRQGNAAFLRGDFLGALASYERAEPAASDPGHVAFNRAAALSRLGRFAEAEACYRQSLEDASGPRRAQALYGLGNSLAEQGRRLPISPAAAQKLATAVDAYRQCLEAQPDEPSARHNLGVAQRWLVKVNAELALRPPEHDGSGGPPQQPGTGIDRSTTGTTNAEGTEPGGSDPGATDDPGSQPGNGKDPGKIRPGRGNLPALLDDKDAPPLPAELAQQYLEVALERIAKERAARPPGGMGTSRGRDY